MTETAPADRRKRGMAASRRLHLIVNPVSASGATRRAWPTINRRLERLGFQVDVRMTESRGDGARLGSQAVDAGVDEVVVVGGDGTLNEVVNGLFAATHGESPPVTVSVLPAGTGRDFSRTMGIRSFDHALETLGNGDVQAVDVGRVDYVVDDASRSIYFVNIGDVGLGAETAALLNRSSKLLGGKISYFLGAARTISGFTGRPARVTVDGQIVHDGPVAMVCFANGRYLAGGMRMAMNASIVDGLFDIFILKDVPKYALLLSLLPRVYVGKHVDHPAVAHLQGRRVSVTAPEPLPFEVDGEQPGTTDIDVTVLPGVLNLRMPRARPVRQPR